MSLSPKPPIAPRRALTRTNHGVSREDAYAWLRERDDPVVREHLEAENAYVGEVMADTKPLQDSLYKEMLARINENDETVPVRGGPFLYFARSFEGKDYWVHCRRPLAEGAPESAAGPEQVYLDENALAQGEAYFSLGDIDVCKRHETVAYTVDTSGDETYTLCFRDLRTGEDYDTRIENVGDTVVWARDDGTIFYLRLDDAHRPYQVWRHRLGTSPAQDVLVYEEADDAFFIDVRLTRSERFVVIGVHSQVTSEEYLIEAATPQTPPRLVAPRRQDVEYAVAHRDDRLLVLTNWNAPTFAVMQAPVDAPDQWAPLRDARPEVTIEDLDVFEHQIVYLERRNAQSELVVHSLATGEEHTIAFPDSAYAVDLRANPNFNTRTLRLSYASMGVPRTIYDYDLETRSLAQRKQIAVHDFDPTDVVAERVWVRAADQEMIPVSLLRRRQDVGRPIPIWLTAYGSYGAVNDPTFSSARVSLLRRGVGVAIAHVRGGADKGRAWYEDGKLLRKKNTFEDFITVAQHLRDEGIAEQLAIYGGSAGGLLIGAVLNARPDLFDVAVGDVPFVDVLNTMLDATLPLTVVEWEEWGNPNDREFFDYMASYAPYENVRAQPYPATLLLAGWSDPRVGYWEPAKFAARLREVGTGDRPLLLKTHLDAGHGGPSGRYAAFEETAFIYAFTLTQLERGARSD